MGTEQKNSICDSCANCNCSFQTGIYREKCDFYIPVKELGYAVVGIEHLRKYRQLQNDYEARLKADLVAMLEEIKTGINYEFHDDGGYYADKDEVDAYIQQKINELKAESEEK